MYLMKKLSNLFLFIIIGLVYNINSYGQWDEAVITEPYLVFYRVDNHSFYEIDKKKKRLYWDNKAIDSTGMTCGIENQIIFNKKRLIFCTHKPKNYFYSIDTVGKNNFIGVLSDSTSIETTLNNFFVRDKINFHCLDLNTLKKTTYFNIDSFTAKKFSNDFGLYKIIELSKNEIMATIRYCYDGCYNYHYFLVDLITKEIKEMTLNNKDPNNELYVIDILKNDNSCFLAEEFSNKIANQYFICDKNFKEISKALYHPINDIGRNYKNGKYISDNIRVGLDNGKIIIITYKFSLRLERSFYRIYKNQELLKEDIKQCSKYELNLSKNMLFAKYNYKFTDVFYQAYFNMFEFYNTEEKKKTRLAKVEHLFTEIDRKNLKTIEIALSKIR